MLAWHGTQSDLCRIYPWLYWLWSWHFASAIFIYLAHRFKKNATRSLLPLHKKRPNQQHIKSHMTFFSSSISLCHHIQLHVFRIALSLLNENQANLSIQHTSSSMSVLAVLKKLRTQRIHAFGYLPLSISFIQPLSTRTQITINLIWITQTHRCEFTSLTTYSLTSATLDLQTVTHYLVLKSAIVCTLLHYIRNGYVMCTVWHFVKTMPKNENRKSQTFQGQTCDCIKSQTRRLDNNSTMYM